MKYNMELQAEPCIFYRRCNDEAKFLPDQRNSKVDREESGPLGGKK